MMPSRCYKYNYYIFYGSNYIVNILQNIYDLAMKMPSHLMNVEEKERTIIIFVKIQHNLLTLEWEEEITQHNISLTLTGTIFIFLFELLDNCLLRILNSYRTLQYKYS